MQVTLDKSVCAEKQNVNVLSFTTANDFHSFQNFKNVFFSLLYFIPFVFFPLMNTKAASRWFAAVGESKMHEINSGAKKQGNAIHGPENNFTTCQF